MNKMPEKLINFRVYRDNDDLIGTADIQTPPLEVMSDTIKGAGILGEVNSPTLGHFGPMPVAINWRVVYPTQVELAKLAAHLLTARGAIQQYDAANGTYRVVPVKVVMKAIPKKTDPGKMAVGEAMDSSWEGEAVYYKLLIDGKEVIELDKYNHIFKVNGEDQLAELRTALGLS